MIRVWGLGVWVDVDLAGSGLDEDEFRRLWGRALVEPASTASRVETAAAPPTPEPPSSEQSPGFDTTAPLASSAAAGSTNVVVLQAGTSFESATQQITRALIEQQWGTLLMLHAGAVADPETGRALAFVAPGGTGKSTLTRLLGLEQRFGAPAEGDLHAAVEEQLKILAEHGVVERGV